MTSAARTARQSRNAADRSVHRLSVISPTGPPARKNNSRSPAAESARGILRASAGSLRRGEGSPNKSPACGSGARWVLRCCHNRACRSLRNAASPPPQRRAAPLVSSPHPIPPAPAQPALPGHRSNEYCIAQASAVIFSGCWTSNPEVDAMTRPECLKRAAECNRLAEATSDPDMKLYLMRLALTWMQSATEAEDKARKAA